MLKAIRVAVAILIIAGASVASAAVKIRGVDIATNTITQSNLAFTALTPDSTGYVGLWVATATFAMNGGGGGGGDNLGNHVATMTLTANYGIAASTIVASTITAGHIVVSSPIVDVTYFGATGDGSADDTTAILAAINSLGSNGGVVFFPSGNYRITSPILLVGKSGVTLAGVGWASSIWANGFNGRNIRCTDCSNITIRDLRLYGDGIDAATSTGGILFDLTNNDNTGYNRFENLLIENISNSGISLNTPILTTLKNVKVRYFVGHGFVITGGTSVSMDSCYAITGTQAGFSFTNVTYSDIRASVAEVTGVGFDFANSKAVTLNGCGTESILNRSTSYPGYGYRVNSGEITSMGCYATGSATNDNYVASGAVLDEINFYHGDSWTSSTTVKGLVDVTGDTMTGPLTISGSTLTVTGDSFSVGASTFVITQGKVAIGTTTPVSGFDYYNDFPSTTTDKMVLQGGYPAGGTGLGYGFSTAYNIRHSGTGAIWTAARVKALESTSYGGALTFETNYGPGTVSATTAERMRITAGGLIGIENPSPTATMHIGPAGGVSSTKYYNLFIDAYRTDMGQAKFAGNWAGSGYWGFGPWTQNADNIFHIGNVADKKGTWSAVGSQSAIVQVPYLNVLSSGTVGSGGLWSNGPITGTGNITAQGQVYASSLTVTNLSTLGPTSVTGSLTLTGPTTLYYQDDRGNLVIQNQLATTDQETRTNLLLNASSATIVNNSGTLVYTLYAINGNGRLNFQGYSSTSTYKSLSCNLIPGTDASPRLNHLQMVMTPTPHIESLVYFSTTNISLATILVGGVYPSSYTIYGLNRTRGESSKFIFNSLRRTFAEGMLWTSGFAPVVTASSASIGAGTFYDGVLAMFSSSTINTSSFTYINSSGYYVNCSSLPCITSYADDGPFESNAYVNVVWGAIPISTTGDGERPAAMRLFAIIQNKPPSTYNGTTAETDIYGMTNYVPPDPELAKMWLPVARTILRVQSGYGFSAFSNGKYYKDIRGMRGTGGVSGASGGGGGSAVVNITAGQIAYGDGNGVITSSSAVRVDTTTLTMYTTQPIVTSSDVVAAHLIGDGSRITNISVSGDNLGNHIATTTLSMSGYNITQVSAIYSDGTGLIPGDVVVATAALDGLPIGTFINYGSTVPPAGYLYCNGVNYSTTTYADLFGVIGYKYSGLAISSGPYFTCDFRGMFSRGVDEYKLRDAEYRVIGSTETFMSQGHRHTNVIGNGGAFGTAITASGIAAGTGTTYLVATREATPDGTNGTPIIGPETRPMNVAVAVMVKYANVASVNISSSVITNGQANVWTGGNTFTGSVTVSSLTVTGGVSGITNSSTTFLTTDYTTSNASFGACVPGSTVTVNTSSGKVNIILSASASHNANSGIVWATVLIDGVPFSGSKALGAYQSATANVRGMITFTTVKEGLTTGAHSFCVAIRTQTGTANLRATTDEVAQFWVQELR